MKRRQFLHSPLIVGGAAAAPAAGLVSNAGPFHGIGENKDTYSSAPLLASRQSGNGAFPACGLPWIMQEWVPNPATVSLEVETGFRDPVLLDLLSGSLYELSERAVSQGRTRFGKLPSTDCPLALVERSALTLDA